MIKNIAFLKCKPGLTRQAFIHYYETRHVPLILSIAPQICDYRRNFLVHDGAILAPGAAVPDFDVVTELWYPDQAAYNAAMAALTDAGECPADRRGRGERVRPCLHALLYGRGTRLRACRPPLNLPHGTPRAAHGGDAGGLACGLRNRRRRKRMANQQPMATSATATAGAASASSERPSAPPHSPVARA